MTRRGIEFGQRQQDGIQWLLGLDEDGEGGLDIPLPGGDADADFDGVDVGISSEVERRVRETGVGREVRNRFQELRTRDRRVRDRTGARLDMRNTIRRVAGDTTVTDLYERYEQVDLGDRTVGIALDMSGSMGSCELDAKSAVGALCNAVRELGDTVVLVAYKGSWSTTTLTGPREEWRWTDLDEVSPGGGTPTATGVRETVRLMNRTTSDESILFVVTDGMPKSVSSSAAAVEAARADGHGVVGVGFGHIDESNLRRMFGADQYTHVGLDELADALVKRYRAELPTTGAGAVGRR